MNLALLLPIASQAVGRDLTPEVALFFRARAAIGASQDQEGRDYFARNWRGVVDFMESESGQEALRLFLDTWRKPEAVPSARITGVSEVNGEVSTQDE